ncbi:hypothetical protein MTO96_023387 [Rhipicephalus appendiculatus]
MRRRHRLLGRCVKPSSAEYPVNLPPMPTVAVTERHITRSEVPKLEETATFTSSESDASQPYPSSSTMSFHLPVFPTSKGHAVQGEARALEKVIVISASKAYEAAQKENDDISIVLGASSDVHPEELPTGVRGTAGSCSPRSSETTTKKGDVMLMKLTMWAICAGRGAPRNVMGSLSPTCDGSTRRGGRALELSLLGLRLLALGSGAFVGKA